MKRSVVGMALAAATLVAIPSGAQEQTLTILRVDRAENRIVVRDPGSSEPRIVDLGATTSIARPGAPPSETSAIDRLSIDDLRPGDRIRVHGSMQGDHLQARRIEIQSAPSGQGGTPRDVGAPAPGGSSETSPGAGDPPVQRDVDPGPGDRIERDAGSARERVPGMGEDPGDGAGNTGEDRVLEGSDPRPGIGESGSGESGSRGSGSGDSGSRGSGSGSGSGGSGGGP